MTTKREISKAKVKTKAHIVALVHAKLDEAHWAEFGNRPPSGMDYGAWLKDLGPEIHAAERGNLGPLLKKHPGLKPFLVAPSKRKRIKDPKLDITMALWAMRQIAKLWKGTGLKQDARKLVTATEIAALWVDPDQTDVELQKLMDEIELRLKKLNSPA